VLVGYQGARVGNTRISKVPPATRMSPTVGRVMGLTTIVRNFLFSSGEYVGRGHKRQ